MISAHAVDVILTGTIGPCYYTCILLTANMCIGIAPAMVTACIGEVISPEVAVVLGTAWESAESQAVT